MALRNAFALVSTEAKQDSILTSLAALLTELQQKLETGGEVALNAGTLAALESITTTIANFPSDYPDAAVLAKAEAIRVLLAATLTITGTVAVSNFPATQPVSAATLPLPSGATTEATLAAMLAEFRNKYDVVSTAKATYTTSGDHTLITPTAGQSLRVVWLFAQAKGALDTGVVLVTFTLGANSYEFELTGSQPFAHGAVWESGVDQALVVNTSSTAAVLVNADYRQF